jgi:folate-binding Fe-S cluster repair protein YgfZ
MYFRYLSTNRKESFKIDKMAASCRPFQTMLWFEALIISMLFLSTEGFSLSRRSSWFLSARRYAGSSSENQNDNMDITSVFDHSEAKRYGVIELSGPDRLSFLHGQCTNRVVGRDVGEVFESSITTSIGRMVDLVHVCIHADKVHLVTSYERHDSIMNLLNKHIFAADKVEVVDRTVDVYLMSITGSKAHELMNKLSQQLKNPKDIISEDQVDMLKPGRFISLPLPLSKQQRSSHGINSQLFYFQSGSSSEVINHDPTVSTPIELMLLCDDTDTVSALVRSSLQKVCNQENIKYHHHYREGGGGGKVSDEGDDMYEKFRILTGRPQADKEWKVPGEWTPLELGLYHTVHFNKVLALVVVVVVVFYVEHKCVCVCVKVDHEKSFCIFFFFFFFDILYPTHSYDMYIIP